MGLALPLDGLVIAAVFNNMLFVPLLEETFILILRLAAGFGLIGIVEAASVTSEFMPSSGAAFSGLAGGDLDGL